MTTALFVQKFGRALRPQSWHDSHNDPCDEWPLFMWNGEACQLGQTTMFDAYCCNDPDIISWKWHVGWQCYIVNIAVPLGSPIPVLDLEGISQ